MVRISEIIWLFWIVKGILGVKPVFDYSNNMRLVLLPSDTKLGSVIYRLRASDADDDYPLQFTAYDSGKGKNGEVSSIVAITHVDCSTMAICEADVILTKALEEKSEHVLSLEVKDTQGETTIVESRLQATASRGPFIGAPRILKVPESTQPGTLIHSFDIRKNLQVFRGVHCHLEPAEIEAYFDLNPGYQTNVKEISRCDLKLAKKLDYEARSAFILQIVAENAWVDGDIDTRNVGVHEVVIEVQDLPDTPPYFLIAPPVTKLPETATVGTDVVQVMAYDGDYAHPRRLRYGLDPTGLPFSNYFDIDPDEGIVRVRKSLQDIDIQPSAPLMLRIFVEELNEEGQSSGESAEADIAIIIDDVINHPPQFLQKTYIASLAENSPEGTTLNFVAGFDRVQDFDKGDNGKLELVVVGFTDTFEISPSIINQDAQFVISVKNNKRLDYEQVRQLNFKIVATELGVSKLTAVADITVNLLDVNDNKPQFTESSFEINIPENQLPGVQIGRVTAFDADSQENGEIQYHKINGNSEMIDVIEVDMNTGDLILVNSQGLDRETIERFALNIEAVDKGEPPLRSQMTLIINILDVNDNPPIFKKRKYQGFMNQDLSDLRNDLQVEAFDLDQQGTKNSEIRYEIIHGNYEKKFFIDSVTGQITVMEALTPDITRQSRQTIQRIASTNVEPMISLTIRAYDLGIPSMDSEVLVHIFTEQTSSRTMRFIVYEDPDILNQNKDEVSDLISAMTGGEAEIQDIQAYVNEIDRMDYIEIDYVDETRGSKDYTDRPAERRRRSYVDAIVTYPATSIVDMNDVTGRLVNQGSSTPEPTFGTTDDPGQVKELEYKNAALFWGLISVVALIVFFFILVIMCYCCPCCVLYKKDLNPKKNDQPETPEDIKVITVKDGQGQDLKDARFVEMFRNAHRRVRSASTDLTRRRGNRFEDDSVHPIRSRKTPFKNKVKVYEPTYRDKSNLIFIRDELESGSSTDSNGPIFVRALEEHSPGKLRQKTMPPLAKDDPKIFSVVDETKRTPSKDVKDNVQIMTLDDENRITETYQKIGNAEVLKIEDNPVAEELTPNVEYQDATTSPKSEPAQRSLSELEILRQKHNLPEEGEFYTAIGPDGKEIILRRYLSDQNFELNSSLNKTGFLNVAMNHLKNRNHKPSDGDESMRSTSDDEGIYSLKPSHGKFSGPPSVISAPDVLVRGDDDPTPKHYIRTPILEETESNVEAELRSRHRSRDSRSRFWNEDPDVSLRFKIQDGKCSPEPFYTETKASILRRRNTLAKMMQQDSRFNARLMAKDRHWSLTDIPRSTHVEEEETYIKRWNSLSNDEMMRVREDRFVYEPGMVTFHKYSNSRLPNKTSMVQMANITVLPNSDEPRKFSKYNPPRKRRSRNEELIYIRQNYPSDRNMRTTVWNRHGAPRNIEIQHISSNPSIAHSNSFGQQRELTLDVYNNASSVASSEMPSRTSSVSNIRPPEGPYLTQEKARDPSPHKKTSQITPRYMNWYTKNKSSVVTKPTAILDAKQLRREMPDINVPSPNEDDTESGISSLSYAGGGKNSSLMQKKSVFTIAYDDASNVQPLTPGDNVVQS